MSTVSSAWMDLSKLLCGPWDIGELRAKLNWNAWPIERPKNECIASR